MNKIVCIRQFGLSMQDEAFEFTGLKEDEDGDTFRFYKSQDDDDRSYYDGASELDDTFNDDFVSFKMEIEYD